MKLLDSTGGPTIGVSEESQVFFVTRGYWNLYVTGTPSTSTLTLQWCRKKDGTFVDYVYSKAGTPTTYTISATEVASSSKGFHDVIIDGGMFFKFVADASGTPAWQIDVNGDHVSPVRIST